MKKKISSFITQLSNLNATIFLSGTNEQPNQKKKNYVTKSQNFNKLSTTTGLSY